MKTVQKAFSLVELLIVIAILSILATISIPRYAKFKKKAVISRVEQELTNCAGELLAEFASNGTTQKICYLYGNNICTLEIDKNNDKVKISTNFCEIEADNIKIKCEIINNYGNVNGKVYCYKEN